MPDLLRATVRRNILITRICTLLCRRADGRRPLVPCKNPKFLSVMVMLSCSRKFLDGFKRHGGEIKMHGMLAVCSVTRNTENTTDAL
jgi:hypothetical protein